MGKVRVTNAGYLYFDFFYNKIRCREYTELKNTMPNLKLMNNAMKKIDGEIQLGTFDYSKYFPNSKLASKFGLESHEKFGVNFKEYSLQWYKNTKISWKPSSEKDFHSILTFHLIPYFNDQPISEITKWKIKEFRTSLSHLRGKKGNKISNKRINNILSLLRMILNEASEQHDFTSPFINLKPLTISSVRLGFCIKGGTKKH